VEKGGATLSKTTQFHGQKKKAAATEKCTSLKKKKKIIKGKGLRRKYREIQKGKREIRKEPQYLKGGKKSSVKQGCGSGMAPD